MAELKATVMKGTYINDLILEVTRRCNMCCDHCLRGEAQDMDISEEMIRTLIDSVGGIGSVTFTGGEPTLNLPAIEYFFEYAAQQGKLPMSFYVVTNGKANQMELATLLLKYFPEMREKELCGVALSVDMFHDTPYDPEFSILKGLSFYCEDKETDFSDETKIIAEGRGAENFSDATALADWEVEDLDLEEEDIEQLYVASNGKLFRSCDASFDHVDEDAIYTVDDLAKIALEYAA